jgi:predicted Zn-dependent protease
MTPPVSSPPVTPSDQLDHVLTTALAQATVPADWIGLRAVQETSRTHSLRDGQPERNSRRQALGVMVEVLAQGQLGYSATPVVTPAGLRQAIQQAYQSAIAAAPWQLQAAAPQVRPPVTGTYRSPQAASAPSPGDINQLLAQICQDLKVADAIVQTRAAAIITETETWLVSSSGSQVHQQFAFLETHYGAIAQDGPVVQTRSNNGSFAHSYQSGADLSCDRNQVQQIGHQAVELLSAPDCPSQTTTLVLAPDQMMLQIHESIGHPLELDRILGDERNYAGGSFVRPEDFGSLVYGSPLMNVTFDPTVPGELASYAFDDTGAPAQRQHLIRQGRLERGLGSLESQTRLGVPGVACARAASWNRPPIDRMANINLEPGNHDFSALISEIDQGIYMETNRSWSIDDQRHKFQFGCEYAKRIENGQLTETLRNPNYRATTPQFWRSLSAVGNRDTWQVYGTPFCGKGEPNQMIRVGHGAPVCAFSQIEVFGGDGA